MDTLKLTTLVLTLNLIVAFYFDWLLINKVLVILNAVLLLAMIVFTLLKKYLN